MKLAVNWVENYLFAYSINVRWHSTQLVISFPLTL
jgi:hypothetical protein